MAALIPSASATGSGTMTLAGPSTNSNQTITIPDATGTMMVSGNMPAFSAYASGNQSISNATFTKLQFNTEEFDTANCFDNATNYRFTPTVAGYYQVNGAVLFGAITSANSFVGIYKNGSRFKDGSGSSTVSSYSYMSVSALVYLNGSTDYVELYCYQSSGSAQNTQVSTPANPYFQAAMIRGA
jgi:hypothetical protein